VSWVGELVLASLGQVYHEPRNRFVIFRSCRCAGSAELRALAGAGKGAGQAGEADVRLTTS
jgi:hypothetical protein